MKFYSLLLLVLILSCKSPINGCDDQNALNYNYQAEENDGTCTYEVRGVFYHEQSFSSPLLDEGVTEINYYVDGQFIGQNIPNVYWSYVPECGSEEAISFSYNIGTNRQRSFNYKLKDQNGYTLDIGNITINGGQCLKIKNS